MSNFTQVKLSYSEFEPTSGSDGSLVPVIYLHGITGTKEDWRDIPQIVADATQRKAYAYDARNHGDSEYIGPIRFDILVKDLFQFMDSINVPRAALVGESMGGLTASLAAFEKPERVEMVFIEDMSTKKYPGKAIDGLTNLIYQWTKAVLGIPKELNPSEAIKHALNSTYSKLSSEKSTMPDKEKFANARFKIRRLPDGGYDVKFNKEAVFEALRTADEVFPEFKGRFKGPAYFIYGSLSAFGVENTEEDIKKYFPNAELIKFEGAAHYIHLEFPEKFSDTIITGLKH